MNGAATHVASGSYSNSFRVFGGGAGGAEATLEATRDPMRKRAQAPPASKGNRFAIRAKNMAGLGKRSPGDAPEVQNDYSSKLLHLAWHPEANVIACAASNSLYMYCA
jgi:serine/threonine-protein phosphatase 2A regulatory subunit B